MLPSMRHQTPLKGISHLAQFAHQKKDKTCYFCAAPSQKSLHSFKWKTVPVWVRPLPIKHTIKSTAVHPESTTEAVLLDFVKELRA